MLDQMSLYYNAQIYENQFSFVFLRPHLSACLACEFFFAGLSFRDVCFGSVFLFDVFSIYFLSMTLNLLF